MYKELIQRRIAYLLDKQANKIQKGGRKILSDFFFSEDKKKEIIVWMWQYGDKDKDQIKEFVIEKFNLSNEDAEKLFYDAFPDGLDFKEEEILDSLDDNLSCVINMKPSIILDMLSSLSGETKELDFEKYNIDPHTIRNIKIVISSLLQRRKLI